MTLLTAKPGMVQEHVGKTSVGFSSRLSIIRSSIGGWYSGARGKFKSDGKIERKRWLHRLQNYIPRDAVAFEHSA